MTATLRETNFHLPGQTAFYRGKVRDVYALGNERLVMVATDRISAFDVVLPEAIPNKGQVLNQLAAFQLAATADLVPNWVEAQPDPCVTVGRRCQPYPVEMVIRGYLTGHAWRTYAAGGRTLCGVSLPDGLREYDPLPGGPIITPTTKAAAGHDEDISREDILRLELVPETSYAQLEAYTRALFQRGSEAAAARGLVLLDTKYEFGRDEDADGLIRVIDEIHTPDSSRYCYADGFDARRTRGEAPRALSKEFVRQWLIGEGFQGRDGQTPPPMTPAWCAAIGARYVELYELLTGEAFVAAITTEDSPAARIERRLRAWLAAGAGHAT
ncbi:MAG: phosphoribosylaminoimidazolesuccinocarboxamide synthase [Hymenobacteraceae bacterium]|nr:phosphoribosylaminoimidazolesuccinocarboxamide synthase [Hymenobacteraceae bacterium]